MKILHINTYEKAGGAAKSCFRLAEAQSFCNADAKVLVRDKTSGHPMIIPNGKNFSSAVYNWSERFSVWANIKERKDLFAFSIGMPGSPLKDNYLEEADLIHLHWINQGYVSFNSLHKLLTYSKPIVWTLHDIWAFTGGCHYSGNCEKYMTGCGECPMLKTGSKNDLSAQIWKQKKHFFEAAKGKITFVTPSKWLQEKAQKSELLKDFEIVHIPNTIDTTFYKPSETNAARLRLKLPLDKKILLFIAMNIEDNRKGFDELQQAINSISKQQDISQWTLAILGKAKKDKFKKINIDIVYLGQIEDEQVIIDAYNAADITVVPSLEDNFPNTILESLACATPVVAFDRGGMREMIDHRHNGLLSKTISDFSLNLTDILKDEEKLGYMGSFARKQIENNYSYTSIAAKYMSLYERLLNHRFINYKIVTL